MNKIKHSGLKKYLKKYGVNIVELEKVLNRSRGTLYNWFKKDAEERRAIELAVNTILNTRNMNTPIKEYEVIDNKYYEYPVLTNVYAGDSPDLFQKENIAEYISFPYHKKNNCFAVRVIGDSMNHKIEEGDIILVDMERTYKNGDLVIARLKSGKQIIKRYRKLSNNEVMFYSDNSNYEPLIVDREKIEVVYTDWGDE